MASAQLLDVTTEIKLDHDNVRELFQRYKSTTDAATKRAIANTLLREIAVHSDAEEASVYNDYAAVGLGSVATHNKEDHAAVKRLVSAAGAHGFDKAGYDDVLAKAFAAFDTHAREEETDQLPTLRQKLSAQDSDRIARAFLRARTTVPQKAAGALADGNFVAVKYAHAAF
ncbi:hypothetical protein DAEQUDRAFT_810601 [Daedalea quercina L-15889]|uniref:Hemerythrin-like domain-containing protein n=1 Tax=Daedalea quercina L-15889 TaxID=1314783 RepID=A0A165R845_9APHY|nr:hypothetical protein DAEQUDRAFT_810601 [Daedalea quercina L-15889]